MPDLTIIRARLTQLVAASVAPVLDEGGLDELLGAAAVADTAGRLPSHPLWVGAWDLYAAAAAGWRVKAGLCSGLYSFSADGQTFNRDEVFEHCLKMAERFDTRAGLIVGPSGTASVAPSMSVQATTLYTRHVATSPDWF